MARARIIGGLPLSPRRHNSPQVCCCCDPSRRRHTTPCHCVRRREASRASGSPVVVFPCCSERQPGPFGVPLQSMGAGQLVPQDFQFLPFGVGAALAVLNPLQIGKDVFVLAENINFAIVIMVAVSIEPKRHRNSCDVVSQCRHWLRCGGGRHGPELFFEKLPCS